MRLPITILTLMLFTTIAFAQTQTDSIFFDENRASLNWKTLQYLNSIAADSTESKKPIVINAVTLENKDMFASRRLSVRRAENAKAYLIALGVDQKMIQILEVFPEDYEILQLTFDGSFLEIRK